MRKIHIYLLFIFIGIIISSWSYFYADSQLVNIKDAYIVIHHSVFSTYLLALYTFLATVYFLSRKYSSYLFGLINICFTTIPLVYFLYSNSHEEGIIPIEYYIKHRTEILWKTVYIPKALEIMFLIGIIMPLTNIISSIIKYSRNKYSASS
jgi:hypothetical protein